MGASRAPPEAARALSYAPHVAFWAQRGRALSAALVGGNHERLGAEAAAKLARRALRLLPAGHGAVDFRVDSAYYAAGLLGALRERGARFSVSVPRTSAMWSALEGIAEDAWQEAIDMEGAEVAETTYTPEGWRAEPLRLIVRRVPYRASDISASAKARRRRTLHPEQLALLLEGRIASTYGYSFILTDHPDERAPTWVEHHHRHRAQIEERIKDAKLGQALRRLPSGHLKVNRVWMCACLAALNLASLCCDLCPAAGASGKAPKGAPLRRPARTLRRLLFCVPARIIRSGRRTILRLPAGFRHVGMLAATWQAAYDLPPP